MRVDIVVVMKNYDEACKTTYEYFADSARIKMSKSMANNDAGQQAGTTTITCDLCRGICEIGFAEKWGVGLIVKRDLGN